MKEIGTEIEREFIMNERVLPKFTTTPSLIAILIALLILTNIYLIANKYL